jgi:Na+/proline symporter
VFVGHLFAQLNMTQGAMRFFSVKDGKEARKSALLAASLMGLGCLVWFIPPMVGRLLYNKEILATTADPAKAAESAYAVTSFSVLPAGLTGVMVVAMFAATISSMDTGLNRNAALIVRNIIPAILRVLKKKEIHHSAEILISRSVTLVMGMVIIGMALGYSSMKGTDLFQIVLNIVTIVMIPTSVPMLFAFLIRKTAPWAAASSILLGFLPSLIQWVGGYAWNYQERTAYVTIGAVLGFLIAIPFYKSSTDEYKKRVGGFMDKMRKPVDFEAEIGGSNDGFQMLVIGKYGMTLGSLLMLLVLVPNPLWGRVCAVAVAGFVLLVGYLLYQLGRRRSTAKPVNRSSSGGLGG